MADSINITLFGNCTTEYIGCAIKDVCKSYGISANIYNSPYSQYNQEILNPDSGFYTSNPSLVILFLEGKLLFPDWYRCELLQRESQEKNNLIESVFSSLVFVIESIQSHTDASIVVNNFKIPYYSPLGIMDYKYQPGLKHMVGFLNMKLEDWAANNPRIYIFDYNGLASQFGNYKAEGKKLFYMAKSTLSFPFIKYLAREYMRIILPIKFRARKCIVLDLDNTLWGGIAGEDGLTGINLDICGSGGSFRDFQKELLNLYHKGILLAVNSKNNYEDAIEIIGKHPYMLLRSDHFSVLKINWQDKVQNLKEIAQELNIGIDSMVFFDDNPMEREYVKSQLPEVLVVDVPVDPSKYVDALQEIVEFEYLTISREDIKRNLMYHENKKREKAKQQYRSLNSYLASLECKVTVEFANEFSIPRIAQLTQKTNQFNMTNKRYTVSEIQELAKNENYIVLSCSVSDKFGDNGIVGVCIASMKEKHAELDTFLLSCRVLGRNIEYVFLSAIVSILKENGVTDISAKYIKSEKNKSNENFYEDAGFLPDCIKEPEKLYSIDSHGCLKSFEYIELIIKKEENHNGQ